MSAPTKWKPKTSVKPKPPGPVTIKDTLPAGLIPKGAELNFLPVGDIQTVHPGTSEERTVNWERSFRRVPIGTPGEGCTIASSTVECEFPTPIMSILPLYCSFFEFYCGVGPGVKHGQRLIMALSAEVPADVTGSLEDTAKVSGGGAAEAEANGSNLATAEEPPTPGYLGFASSITDSSGNPYTQAGGHPYKFNTEFNFETYSNATEGSYAVTGVAPVHDPKDITAELPPGLVVNPQAVPHCSLADYYSEACENQKDAVGSSCIRAFARGEGHCHLLEPVYNLVAEKYYPAEFGVTVGGAPFIVITTHIRSDGDYGANATDIGIQSDLTRVGLTLWGVPAEEGHNGVRGRTCQWVQDEWGTEAENYEECEEGFSAFNSGGPAETEEKPFLTLPTECGEPLTVTGRYDTWSLPGEYAEDSVQLPPMDSCNQLQFEPEIEAQPTTDLADAPSGLNFHLKIPQNENPHGVATPALKESVVKLPAGLTLNPAAAQGLEGCTEAQIGLHSDAADQCPESSKLGEVEIESPLLHEPLRGFLFAATPYKNPSHSLVAGYISVYGQGVRIKLPGSFETDPQSGQITAKFPQNPQLPFENLKLSMLGGPLAALRTPAVCGTYTTEAELTPFSAPESGPPAKEKASFKITTPSSGAGTCPTSAAAETNAPLLRAGTETPQAGIYSPMSLKLVREDGSQEISSIDTTLPQGLVARLADIPYCPDAAIAAARGKTGAEEKAGPSCPQASEVGTVETAAGAGPTPLNVLGHAYLAGPYRGAPLSLAIITPALAGPFDLGTVVVRAALNINPQNAQVTAVSDEIPKILKGIPLDIRSITVSLNRPSFTLNPTSCELFSFTGSETSTMGASAPLSQRFQVGGCNALRFKPSLALSIKGSTRRGGSPALKAMLKTRPGDANIGTAQVSLPSSELLDNAHLKNTCSRVQLTANQCPANSVYGTARATTPLLSAPLEGPVYLGTGYGHRLPDLVAVLNGQIQIILNGRIDSAPHGGIRTTFESLPDAPVSSFTLEMGGGKKSLLENSTNTCRGTRRVTELLSGQNGKVFASEPKLRSVSCKGGAHHHRARSPRRAAMHEMRAAR